MSSVFFAEVTYGLAWSQGSRAPCLSWSNSDIDCAGSAAIALGRQRLLQVGGNCGAKTRGMGAGRKLKTHRRRQRWADKSYKKSHLGNEWKKPFAGSSHAKGIVLEKM
ncbi:hypothetical protein BHE74_00032572 [Ensete ventricosum]|nr:hypothetical protein BHE74_00032572 [Ensete ventricosum]